MEEIVEIRESRRARRLRLIVSADEPPRLVVPVGTSAREIRRMLRENRTWMERKTAELRRREARRPKLGLGEPGSVPLLGNAVPVRWAPERRAVASLRRGSLHVGGEREAAAGAIERWYRREARERIGRLVDREAAALGVKPTRISVRDQRTRWGSCSSAGALSFSWRLLLMPYEVLDYIVVHELCHLHRMDHSPAFWDLVAAARPGYDRHIRWLRTHGPELGAYDPLRALAPREAPHAEPAGEAEGRLFDVSPLPARSAVGLTGEWDSPRWWCGARGCRPSRRR